jgi:hypothetical protein
MKAGREGLAIEIDTSLPAEGVTCALEHMAGLSQCLVIAYLNAARFGLTSMKI